MAGNSPRLAAALFASAASGGPKWAYIAVLASVVVAWLCLRFGIAISEAGKEGHPRSDFSNQKAWERGRNWNSPEAIERRRLAAIERNSPEAVERRRREAEEEERQRKREHPPGTAYPENWTWPFPSEIWKEYHRFRNLPEPDRQQYEDRLNETIRKVGEGQIHPETKRLQAQRSSLSAEADRIEHEIEREEASRGFWAKLAGDGGASWTARKKIKEIRAEMLRLHYGAPYSITGPEFAEFAVYQLRKDRRRQRKATQKEATAKAKQARKEQIEAAAAAHFGKTREEADKVKRSLQAQVSLYANCPYCNGAMDGNLHADHIYPVAKGGLSTRENMVYVCGSCNLKKRDKTLREFILQTGYDRDRIERILHQLGKTF